MTEAETRGLAEMAVEGLGEAPYEALWEALAVLVRDTVSVALPAAAAEGVGSTVPCGVPLPPVSCVPVGEEVGEMLEERVTVTAGETLPVGSALKVLVPVLLSLT